MAKPFRNCTPKDETSRESVDGRENKPAPGSVRDSMTLPAARVGTTSGPAGETGVLPAVRVLAEGVDHSDGQDASRTTAETAAVPNAQRDTPTAMPVNPLVLIVEDAQELAELIQMALQRVGIQAVIETQAHRALERFNELQPEVVLLDIGLPDMTGWELLDYMRESVGERTMPIVIVITAYGDAANRLVGRLQNVHAYLVKPFTGDEVINAVRQALNGKVG